LNIYPRYLSESKFQIRSGESDSSTVKDDFYKKLYKTVDSGDKKRYNIICSQEWRNWQTRTVQVRVVAIP
jgi:hypothetical protein